MAEIAGVNCTSVLMSISSQWIMMEVEMVEVYGSENKSMVVVHEISNLRMYLVDTPPSIAGLFGKDEACSVCILKYKCFASQSFRAMDRENPYRPS